MEKFININNKEEAKDMFLDHKDMLYRFILVKTKNSHLSDDLVSETFVKFFKYGLKNKINKEKAKSLLFTIAANNITDYFRRKNKISFISLDKPENKKSNFLESAMEDKTDKKNSIPSTLEEKIETINEIACQLPEKQQEAFYLRFTQNLNFIQIAEIQNTSVSTVLSRVRYSINKIKKSLNIRGLKS